MNKYKAKKTEVNGIMFDSRKEAGRYVELKMLEKAGYITDLRLQQKFVLIPAQKKNGKTVERECSYIADFVYADKETGEVVVEDTKGFRTDTYKIKRKLMLYVHGIEVKEL
ncbi:MAG: DUF1064 domain-containing protein [Firmicutes bacterium]|jgi:hypothetical protein|nr:DUF1064 domain-containing protein [Bacillota bacterium]